MSARALMLALAMLAPVEARADDRITDDTAYKTPAGHVRAGLWKLEYAIHGTPVELGSYWVPYLSYAVGVRTVNAHLKWQILDRRVVTLATSLGFTRVAFDHERGDARVAIVPLQLLANFRLSRRWTLGAGMMFTALAGEGGYNEDETTEFRGAIAADNAQSWVSLMLGLTDGLTLYLEGRAISTTQGGAEGDLTHQIDDRTRVDVMATGNASIDEMRGGSVLVAMQYSRTRFRARLGLGYGNYNIPVLNFIIPAALPFPELDISFVF